MAPRPQPTLIFHFTHIDHLTTIASQGLASDTVAQRNGLIITEVGNLEIKARRRRRAVPVQPGGFVADFAPFYFAPPSPMMYVIHRGSVPTHTQGCDDLVYLVTTVERLTELGATLLFTDRNAVLDIAKFSANVELLDEMIDWQLMGATMWNNTPDQPDRKERRMAECLVHEQAPWGAFAEVAAKNQASAQRAQALLATVGSDVPVSVRRDWYF